MEQSYGFQFFGFLGPNGAGKSTTIKMLTGLLEPSAGTIEILGQPFGAGALDIKRQIGVVPEGMALLGRLTATEYLRFVGRMYGLDIETTRRRTEELLEFMQLANENKKLVTDFSHGMQKKLALAAAVIHGPKVLFLDEPFEGVDAIAAGMLKSMLQGMINRGATIFLTTHVLEIVERLCSHVAIISKGRLVANGSIEALRSGVASTLPGEEQEQRLTLEEIFLSIVGAGGEQEPTQELLEFMQLANETKKLVTDYSHGMQKKLALAAAVIHGPKVLFLDEPFEGVDAIAAGMLKNMLTGMINRGATIFLTTHVLEIVERLCSHVAIISKGRLVANGSLDELRAGVASTLPGAEQEQRLTLEEIFLAIVGAGGQQEQAQELTWLT